MDETIPVITSVETPAEQVEEKIEEATEEIHEELEEHEDSEWRTRILSHLTQNQSQLDRLESSLTTLATSITARSESETVNQLPPRDAEGDLKEVKIEVEPLPNPKESRKSRRLPYRSRR